MYGLKVRATPRIQTGPAGCEANGAIRGETIGLTAGGP